MSLRFSRTCDVNLNTNVVIPLHILLEAVNHIIPSPDVKLEADTVNRDIAIYHTLNHVKHCVRLSSAPSIHGCHVVVIIKELRRGIRGPGKLVSEVDVAAIVIGGSDIVPHRCPKIVVGIVDGLVDHIPRESLVLIVFSYS